MSTILNTIATALLTYGAHSVVACLFALALARALKRPHDRDLLWKAALVLPLLTSITVMGSAEAGASRMRIDLARVARQTGIAHLPGRRVMVRVFDDDGARTVLRDMIDPVTTALSIAAIVAAVCCVLVTAIRLVKRRRALSRALAHRQVVEGAPFRGIAVSVATELPSPVALRGPEICLPAAVMTDFSDRHRDTLIAHEVAHIERRDPAWFAIVEVITMATAFQPLVFLVAREFRRDVELICDEAAVRRTNDAQGLIGALAMLASPFDAQSYLYGIPTAYDGSPLVDRATRITTIYGEATTVVSRRPAFLAISALALTLGFLPVVSSAPRLEDFPAELHAINRRIVSDGSGHVHAIESVVVNRRSVVLATDKQR